MRHTLLQGVLVLAAVLALPAYAGWSVQQHGTRDKLTWHDTDGQALDLASPQGQGIESVHIAPAGRDNLRQGDVITAVDGQTVAHVADLLVYTNAHLQASTVLTVRRGHADLKIGLAPGELATLLHPHP